MDVPRSSFYEWYGRCVACFLSHELKKYLETHEIRYYAPAELTERIRKWVEYYNHQRYHEAIDNVTPADKYYGRDRVILKKREKVRQETMKMRRELNRMAMPEPLPNGVS
jgi:hypothetical protein